MNMMHVYQQVDETFNVMAITKFLPEDYERFLKDEVLSLPGSNFQPIIVT